MNIGGERVKSRNTDAVFERGVNYRGEGRVRQLDQLGEPVMATISGSRLYDVTVKFSGRSIGARCVCPYDGSGDCKHVVAVLLDITASPPQDEDERIEAVVDDVSVENLRGSARDALAEYPELREQPLARFGDDHRSVEGYREGIARLFGGHADPVVFKTIDFSRSLEITEQYRDRERYLAAATVYRTVLEGTDEKYSGINDTYNHYAKMVQTALDGYVDYVLATDPTPEELDTCVGVPEARATAEPRINDEQSGHALDDLEERYGGGS